MAETAYPSRTRRREHIHDDDLHTADDVEYREDERVTTGGAQLAAGFRDRVRWGPIWAGLIAAVTTFLILMTGAIAIGVAVLSPTTGTDTNAGMTSAIVTSVIALIAFFVGGYVAGWTLGGIGKGYGALNGFLVWGLGVGVLLILTAFGLGSLFGAAGELFAQFQQFQSFQVQGVDASQVINAIQNTAIGAFLGMILPAAAAAIGGWVGAMTAPTPQRVEA